MYNLIFAFLAMFLFSACGAAHDPDATGEEGSIAFSLEWEKPTSPIPPLTKGSEGGFTGAPQLAPSPDVCVDYGINNVSAKVYNSSNTQVASASWSCSAHQGDISNVPTGTMYLRLEGSDAYGVMLWRGEKTGITVNANQTTNAGTITMIYVGSDTTRPTVVSTTPASSATDVPVTSAITATFSEAMAPSTINSSTFTVKAALTPVSGSVSYDSATKTATFTPSANLAYSTTYTATVTKGVTDMAANSMASDYAWSFATEVQPTTVPTAPTGITAIAGDGQIMISWQAVPGATSYNIYWSNTSGVTKTTGTKITGVTSPYTHTGLTNGTTYYYVVTAVNSYGESGESNQVWATPQVPAPSAPSGVTASPSYGQVIISWNAVSGATSYNIYWSDTSGVTKTSGTKIPNVTSPYIHTGLTCGWTYYYVVTALNDYGESVESSQVSATPYASTLAFGLNGASGIAVDSTSVYLTEYSGGTVKKVGINGGTVTTLASGLGYPRHIAVDATNVYWTEDYGSVKKVGINGGTVTTLASPYYANGIAVDSTSVYWTETLFGTGSVKKVGINGGTVTTLASGLNGAVGIAVDSTSVYWTENDAIKKVGINGGTVTTLSSGIISPLRIAVDSASVYWTEYDAIKKVGINGGTVTTLASGIISPLRIAVDSTSVYWTASSSVKKVGINGGTVTILSSGGEPGDIAVDPTSVYWTETGTVKKTAK